MSKQTAVEWLVEKYELVGMLTPSMIERAKAMEKQQSITDYCEGFKASGEGWNGEYGLHNILDVAGEIDAEQYYLKTYKGGEQ